MRAFLARFWGAVPPPRTITTITAATYLILAAAGASALLHPPSSIAGTWGHTLTNIWGAFLLAGGAGAAAGAITGRWMIEKPAMLAVATGVIMYGTGILSLHFAGTGNRLVQLGFVTVVLAQLVIRFLRIHKFSYEPGR